MPSYLIVGHPQCYKKDVLNQIHQMIFNFRSYLQNYAAGNPLATEFHIVTANFLILLEEVKDFKAS